MSEVSIKSLLLPSKTVSVEFDEEKFPGFKLSLCHLAREEMIKLRKKCISTKFDRKTRQPVEEVDEDLFLELYNKATIKGWEGFKYKYLRELVLADIGTNNPEDEVAYSEENSKVLLQNSSEFDTWVTQEASNLENFTTSK